VQSITTRQAQNYTAERITVDVIRDGKSMMYLYPEKRSYRGSQQPGTLVAIHSTLKEDLYVVYAGRDGETGRAVLHAYRNPLVKWIWLGGVVLVLGTCLGLLPNRQPAVVLQRALAREPEGRLPAAVPAGVHRSQSHEATD